MKERFARRKPLAQCRSATLPNLASQRTLEALGAEFVEIRRMPSDYPYIAYYPPEARVKRRYKWMPPGA